MADFHEALAARLEGKVTADGLYRVNDVLTGLANDLGIETSEEWEDEVLNPMVHFVVAMLVGGVKPSLEDTQALDEIAAEIERQPDCGSDFIGFVCNVVGATGRHIAQPDD